MEKNAGVKRKREIAEANIEGGEEALEKRQDGTSEAKKRCSVEQAAERSEESKSWKRHCAEYMTNASRQKHK